ncbi:MAG TPA: hypothetical protein VGQ83_27675 [Polyangia bacterium]|jgi:hypothetical protein
MSEIQNQSWRDAVCRNWGSLSDGAYATAATPPPLKLARDAVCGRHVIAKAKAPPPPPPRAPVDIVVHRGMQAMRPAVKDATNELLAHTSQGGRELAPLLAEIGGGAGKAAFVVEVGNGVMLFFEMIGEIAKAKVHGDQDASRRAVGKGFATVAAEVLRRGHLTPLTCAGLKRQALQQAPTLKDDMWRGAVAAAKLMQELSPAQRREFEAAVLKATPRVHAEGAPERVLEKKIQALFDGAHLTGRDVWY